MRVRVFDRQGVHSSATSSGSNCPAGASMRAGSGGICLTVRSPSSERVERRPASVFGRRPSIVEQRCDRAVTRSTTMLRVIQSFQASG